MDLQRAGGTKLLQRVVQEDLDCQVLRWFSGKINGRMSNSYLPICQFLLLVRLLTSCSHPVHPVWQLVLWSALSPSVEGHELSE